MSRGRLLARGLVGSFLVASCLTACGTSGVCDAAALQAALDGAAAGSTVEVGACRVDGRFTVRNGVRLLGRGPALSTIGGTGTTLVVEGAGATIEGLRIEPGSGHGIVATAATTLTVRDVEVHMVDGRAAIGVEDVDTVVMTDVVITGPVTRENAIDVPSPPTAADTALYGLAIVGSPSVTLERVSVTGFALAGAALLDDTTTWMVGTVSTNLGLGIWVSGGSAELRGLTVSDTLRGFRGEPTYGVAAGGGASIESHDLTIERTEGGFGLLHDGGSGMHDGLVASDAAAGGVIAQRTTALSVLHADLHDNDFGGLIAVEAGGLVIEDSAISTTTTQIRMMADWGMVRIGDGLQIVRPTPGTAIRRTMLMGNERAGMLVDLAGGSTADLEWSAIEVDAAGTAVGCVVQNGTMTPGWDSSVTRTGAAIANDAAFAGGLDIVQIIGPSDLPLGDGLVGIIGPSD